MSDSAQVGVTERLTFLSRRTFALWESSLCAAVSRYRSGHFWGDKPWRQFRALEASGQLGQSSDPAITVLPHGPDLRSVSLENWTTTAHHRQLQLEAAFHSLLAALVLPSLCLLISCFHHDGRPSSNKSHPISGQREKVEEKQSQAP